MNADEIDRADQQHRNVSPTNLYNRILVVEDEALIRRVYVNILAYAGYQVENAVDGAQGWEMLERENFDLLITDHDMPNLTGLALIEKVRSSGMTLPIVLVTGWLPREEVERNKWPHINAILLKPFSEDRLLETVRSLLTGAARAHAHRDAG